MYSRHAAFFCPRFASKSPRGRFIFNKHPPLLWHPRRSAARLGSLRPCTGSGIRLLSVMGRRGLRFHGRLKVGLRHRGHAERLHLLVTRNTGILGRFIPTNRCVPTSRM